MAVYLIVLPLIVSSLFILTSQDQQHSYESHRHLINELNEAKLKITRLEVLLEERIQKVDDKSDYIVEREKLIDEIANEIRDLQSVISNIKDGELHTEERIAALEEEVPLLWAASRKNNFDIHNLESRAEEADDRLEEFTSHVEKMADIVSEQWIQFRHLEQALQVTEMRVLSIQRELRSTRCTFLKFANDVRAEHIPKLFGMLDSHSSEKGSTLGYCMSQALQQLKRLFATFKKFHHEFQGFIKQEMRRNEFTAALGNEELVFFVASALIIFPILAAWMLLFSQ